LQKGLTRSGLWRQLEWVCQISDKGSKKVAVDSPVGGYLFFPNFLEEKKILPIKRKD